MLGLQQRRMRSDAGAGSETAGAEFHSHLRSALGCVGEEVRPSARYNGVRTRSDQISRLNGLRITVPSSSGPELPSVKEVLAAIPFRFKQVVYGFTPDRLDPSARPEPIPVEEGVMQIRGAWPEMPPFAVRSVWEH
jgi:hypothetical protein